VTDGQTDRRTDRQTDRILLAIPRLHYMQRGNKITVKINTISLQTKKIHITLSELLSV